MGEEVARRVQDESEMLQQCVIACEESKRASCNEIVISKDEVKENKEALCVEKCEETSKEEKRQRQANTETVPNSKVVRVASGVTTTRTAQTVRTGRCAYGGLEHSQGAAKKSKRRDAKRAELKTARDAFEEAKRILKEEAQKLEEGRNKSVAEEGGKTGTNKEEVSPSEKCDEALEVEERKQRVSVIIKQESQIWAVVRAGIDSVIVHEHQDVKSAKLGRLTSGA